jgi:hypothetical protein
MFNKRGCLLLAIGISACAFHADLGTNSTTPGSVAPKPPTAAAAPAPAAAPAAPTLAAGPAMSSTNGSPRYMGCFIDSNDHDLNDLDKGIGGLSLEVCAAQCRERNSQYFGAQGGIYCYCGRSYGRYGKVNDSECKEPCQGNNKQMCGGPWRNSVYQLR